VHQGMIRNALIGLACAVVIFVQPVSADPKQMVLNCKIEHPAPERLTQIMIDEDAKIVIYDYQKFKAMPNFKDKFYFKGKDQPRPVIELKLDDGQTVYGDPSMTITTNDKQHIAANNSSDTILITKHDGRFARSYVVLLPAKSGKDMFPAGDTHLGTCSRSPFD